ncbi:hypothetical protein Bbelb_422340 [Branchiostoma belcheri]|nr:hypothetical protein Bbelb_422340 [Branchiostoma belcheri]
MSNIQISPPKIRCTVGHTNGTSRAAVRIKKERYPDTGVILFSTDIPEDTENFKGDEKAMGIGKKEDSILEDAQQADVVFSLGNKIFDHFENQFRAIPASKRPQHVKFVPRPSKIFEDAKVEYKDTETMVVLSIGRVKGVEKLKGYDLAAKTLSIVAVKMKVKWHVIGFNKDDFEATKAILQHCKSANLQVTFLPYGTHKKICKEMMQAHLVLMPSPAEPFGLVGLEAIAAGVPVLVSSKSGLADFIHEHVDELHHSIVDMDGSDESTTVRRWAEAIERVLKHNRAEFKTAARGKEQLLSTKYWEKFHLHFIKACMDTGNAEEQPAPVQEQSVVEGQETDEGDETPYPGQVQTRKRDTDPAIDTESRKAKKKDMSGLWDLWFTYKSGEMDNLLHSSLIREETLQRAENISVKSAINKEDFRKALVYLLTTSSVEGQPVPQEYPLYQPNTHISTTTSVLDVLHLDGTNLTRYSGKQHELPIPPATQTEDSQDQLETKLRKLKITDDQQTTKAHDDITNVPQEISELVSLDIRELEQLMGKPRKRSSSMSSQSSGYGTGTPRSGPSRPFSPTGEIETQTILGTLLAELNTPAVMEDKVQQFDLYSLAVAIETENKTEQMDIYCMLGDLHSEQLHKPQESHKYYTKMLALARDLGRKDWEVIAYNRLGLVHCDMGEHEKSLEWNKKDLKMRKESGDKTGQITAHQNMAVSYKALGKLELARSHYYSALTIAMETGNKTEQMDIYCEMGDLYREQLHKPQKSHKYYTKMLALARDLGRKDWEVIAYNRLGLVHHDMGEEKKSLEWHKKGLKMRQESGHKTQQITAHQNIAGSYEALGKLVLARSHYYSAMAIAMETGNKTEQIDIYREMGDLYREQLHEPQESHKYYTKMLALARDLGRKDREGQAYNRLGLAHYDMGEHEKSLKWNKKDLKIRQESGDKIEQIIAHQNMAVSYEALGKLVLARSHYYSTLTIAMETGNKQQQMDIYCKLGDLHREQLHEPQESHKYYTKMLALARDLGRKEEEVRAYNRLGMVHYDMGEESLECFKKDLKMSQESGDKTGQITAHQNIADSYKAQGKLVLARSHNYSALAIAMETGNKQQQMDIYCEMGDLYREQLHEPQESHKYYTKMLALARDLGKKDREMQAYNRLGLAHYDMGEHEKCLEWEKKHLKMSQESKDTTIQITAHQNIADSYKALGKLVLARSHYQSAMTIAMETGNKTEQMDICCELGDLHREQLHEPQESHKYYTEMLALARDLGRKDREGQAYKRLGQTYYDMGEHERSLEWNKKDLKMRQGSGDKTGQITAHQNIADSYKALGKLVLARSHYYSAVTIALETGNKQQQMDIAKKLANL